MSRKQDNLNHRLQASIHEEKDDGPEYYRSVVFIVPVPEPAGAGLSGALVNTRDDVLVVRVPRSETCALVRAPRSELGEARCVPRSAVVQ